MAFASDDMEYDEEDQPYSSISSRPPLENVSTAVPSSMEFHTDYGPNLPEVPQTPAVPQVPIRNQVSQAIAKKQGPDLALQALRGQQASFDQSIAGKNDADLMANLGAAFSTLSQGANTPRDNGLSQMIARQAQEKVANQDKQAQLRNQIAEHIENRKSKESEAQANRDMRQAMLAGAQANKDAAQDLAVNRTMGQVVQRINNDPLIKPSEINLASLGKSKAILENKDVPLTPQLLSDSEQDIASAQQLRGQGATEGKIKRIELETIGRKLAEAKQKWGNQIVDLRKTDPELVEQVRKMNQALSDDYKTTIQDRYDKVLNKYSAAFGDNPKFQDRLNRLRSTIEKDAGPKAPPAADTSKAGQLVRINGKLYKVGSDGDSLEEVMP